MKSLIDAYFAYLVGIKGVGMTAIAQCLIDAGLKVAGADLEEEFVTQNILDRLSVQIDIGFDHEIDPTVDVVVYSSAHHGSLNPIVQKAKSKQILTLSLAEALAHLFNQKSGIAVCGVGGKSTVSAMMSFILTQLKLKPSFAVGVGRINKMNRTGRFDPKSEYFIAEADEYAANPELVKQNQPLVPRFKYLEPSVIICTNLKFDHPDVYQDFNQTKDVFNRFFQQLKSGGALVINTDDAELVELAYKVVRSRPDIKLLGYGKKEETDVRLIEYRPEKGVANTKIKIDDQDFPMQLTIPGRFNAFNALACVATCNHLGLPTDQVLAAISQFASTQRRLEKVGELNQVVHFDDYAHHPSQLAQTYEALTQWYDPKKILFAFQPHTFSRTKALFDDFVSVLSKIDNLILVDIFPSAREERDESVSANLLAEAIIKQAPDHQVQVVANATELAKLYQATVKPGWMFVTVGAGDIYKVHQLLLRNKQPVGNKRQPVADKKQLVTNAQQPAAQ